MESGYPDLVRPSAIERIITPVSKSVEVFEKAPAVGGKAYLELVSKLAL